MANAFADLCARRKNWNRSGDATISIGADINNTAGDAIFISELSGGSVTFAGNISHNASGTGIRVRGINNGTNATVNFSGSSIDIISGGSQRGIDLGGTSSSTITNGTINFTGGDLDITTSTGTGLIASGGGTLNVTGVGNSVTGSMTAVDINGTTIGGSGITFESISVNGSGSSTVPAIELASTGSGSFTVTGTGSTDGSGGTLQNINADAVTLDNTDGLVTLKNMTIQDVGDLTGSFHTRSGHDGIHGQQVDGGLTLDNVTIRRISDNAVNGALLSDGLGATVWNGLQILNGSLIQDTNRFHVPGVGDSTNESGVRMVGLKGTVLVENSTFERVAGGLDIFTDTAGTLDMTVQGNTFNQIIKEFTSSPINSVGGIGVDVTQRGSLDSVIRIGDPAETNPALGNSFTNNRLASIRIGHENTSDTGDIDLVISQNTFTVDDHYTDNAPGAFDFAQGGVSLRPRGGTYEAIFSQNTFDQVMNADGGVGQLSMIIEGRDSEFIVRNNTFGQPWNGPVELRADGNNSAAVLFTDNNYPNGTVGATLPNDLGFETPVPFLPFIVDVRNSGSLDLTMDTEDLAQHDDGFSGFANSLDISTQSAGDVLNLHIVDSKSPDGYRLENGGGTFNLYRGASASAVPATIIDDNNNTGGNGVAGVPNPAVDGDNTDPPVVVTSGTISAVNTAPTLPIITIPLSASGGQSGNGDAAVLTGSDLESITAEAIARWASTGLSQDQLGLLSSVSLAIADLSGGRLAESFAGGVRIDIDAAGYGWFVDPTPEDDDEFDAENRALGGSAAEGRMDLLTVIIHELGHVLGFGHSDEDSLMGETLELGTRYEPVVDRALEELFTH